MWCYKAEWSLNNMKVTIGEMMSEPPTFRATKPCHNKCIMKGTEKNDEPTLMGAVHGNFCDIEYHAINGALAMAAETVEHVVSLFNVRSASEDNVQSSRDAPLPFNVQAFNDANETYSRLVYWTNLWAEKLKRQPAGAAKRSWTNDAGATVGLPFDVTPTAARYAVSTMAIWLQAHLADITWQEPADDVAYFHDEMKDVFRIAARWPWKMHARYAKIPCHVCGARISVYPPEALGDHMHIVCDNGHIYEEDEFELQIRVFAQVRSEEDRARKAAARLAKKYTAA